MTYINLLPPEDKKNNKVIFFIIGIILYFMVMGGIYFYHLNQVKLLEQRLAIYEKQIEIMEPTLDKLAALKDDRKEMKTKIDLATEYGAGSAIADNMVQISKQLPDRARLIRIDYQDGAVNLEGEAVDYSVIADFIAQMKDSSDFNQVELLSSYIKDDKIDLVGFKISAQLKDEYYVK